MRFKWFKTNYYQRNRERILNRGKKLLSKDVLREQARNYYRELSNVEKDIKREYGRKRYHNKPEKNKQMLKEYQKLP